MPPERLILSTDCGFGREGLARRIAFYKCVAINLGANIVRRELKLPEVPIPAADPRWTFADEARMRRALALALVLVVVVPVLAQERVVVTLGTATPGGGFPGLRRRGGRDHQRDGPDARGEPRNTKGSTENVPLLERGELDLGLVQGEVVHEALTGVGRPPADLRILAAMYSTPGMFVVRADSPVRRSPTCGASRSRSARGARGWWSSRATCSTALGLDQERDFQAVYLERAGDGPAMVLDGRVAALWGGGIGWPGFTAVAKSPAARASSRPTPTDLQRIQAKHAFLKPHDGAGRLVPGPGGGDPVGRLVELHPGAARRSPTTSAYRLARALHRGEAALAARLPQASETTAANTVAAAPRPELMHPGVRRYLREAGLLK